MRLRMRLPIEIDGLKGQDGHLKGRMAI